MIVRTGGYARRVFRPGFGGLRSRFVGTRPAGLWGTHRGYFGGGYRPGLRGVYGARLRPWVHRPYGVGVRPWRAGYLRPGVRFARPGYYGQLAPWARGGYPVGGSWRPRHRPWIFRNALPAWLWRYFPAMAPAVDTTMLPPPADPMVLPGAPPSDGPVGIAPPDAGSPPADAAAPPDAAGAPADAPPSDGPGASGAGASPADGAAPAAGDGAAPPTGELPDLIATNGRQVRIRWDHRARPLGEAAPPGGGVYVVFRDGRPAAIHMTSDFRRDITSRFPDAAGEHDDAHEDGEQGEQFWGRPGRSRRFRRFGRYGRRRFARFGRIGGFGRSGRSGRISFLRALRQQMPTQDTGDDDSDSQSDDGDDT